MLSQPSPHTTAAAGHQVAAAAGQSLLWKAALDGNLTEVHSLLSSMGAPVLLNLKDKDGTAPMHTASHGGHVEIVRARWPSRIVKAFRPSTWPASAAT